MAGQEHVSWGNNFTPCGSVVPSTVKMLSLESREIRPSYTTVAARSTVDASTWLGVSSNADC